MEQRDFRNTLRRHIERPSLRGRDDYQKQEKLAEEAELKKECSAAKIVEVPTFKSNLNFWKAKAENAQASLKGLYKPRNPNLQIDLNQFRLTAPHPQLQYGSGSTSENEDSSDNDENEISSPRASQNISEQPFTDAITVTEIKQHSAEEQATLSKSLETTDSLDPPAPLQNCATANIEIVELSNRLAAESFDQPLLEGLEEAPSSPTPIDVHLINFAAQSCHNISCETVADALVVDISTFPQEDQQISLSTVPDPDPKVEVIQYHILRPQTSVVEEIPQKHSVQISEALTADIELSVAAETLTTYEEPSLTVDITLCEEPCLTPEMLATHEEPSPTTQEEPIPTAEILTTHEEPSPTVEMLTPPAQEKSIFNSEDSIIISYPEKPEDLFCEHQSAAQPLHVMEENQLVYMETEVDMEELQVEESPSSEVSAPEISITIPVYPPAQQEALKHPVLEIPEIMLHSPAENPTNKVQFIESALPVITPMTTIQESEEETAADAVVNNAAVNNVDVVDSSSRSQLNVEQQHPPTAVVSNAAEVIPNKIIVKKNLRRMKKENKERFQTMPISMDGNTDQIIIEEEVKEEPPVVEVPDPEPFSPQETIIYYEEPSKQQFEQITELGHGRFGKVWKYRDTQRNLELAGKIIRIGPAAPKKDIEREVDILKQLRSHPQLIWLHSAYIHRRQVVIFTELVTGGELFERIIQTDKLTEVSVVTYMRQILLGVQFMHSKKIIHRDLKPENILCKSPQSDDLKIVDFGFAVRLDEGKDPPRKIAGTTLYMAPETINFDPQGTYTDMWSVGVIAYNLLCGVTPFEKPSDGDCERQLSDHEIISNIVRGQYDFVDAGFNDTSESAKDFISKLLQPSTRKRPSADDCLTHPWLEKKPAKKVQRVVSMNRLRMLIYMKKAKDDSGL